MHSAGKCYLSHSWQFWRGPHTEPQFSDRGHTDEWSRYIVSLKPAGRANARVLSRAWFFFFLFIYILESNPFICDLTCNDEIKLCWLFHKCTYQRRTSSPMPMRWAGWSLSIQYACLHPALPTDTQASAHIHLQCVHKAPRCTHKRTFPLVLLCLQAIHGNSLGFQP